VREGFLSVSDRFTSLDYRVRNVEERLDRVTAELVNRMDVLERTMNDRFGHLQSGVEGLRADVDRLAGDVGRLSGRVDVLGDDMRQRFRGVTDRIAAIEDRLAA
jgi:archaellum component FlaC